MNFKLFQYSIVTPIVLVLLLVTSTPSYAGNGLERVLLKEINMKHKSSCSDGSKTSSAQTVFLPDEPMAFDKVETQVLKDKGNAWKSASYDPLTRKVTLQVTSQAHDDCFYVGPWKVRSNTSEINVIFKVYAFKNSCDPIVKLPAVDSVNAVEYANLLEAHKRQIKCNSQLGNIHKKQTIEKIKQVIHSKLLTKKSQNDLAVLSQVAQLKAMNKDLSDLKDVYREQAKEIYKLSLKLKDQRQVFEEVLNFTNKSDQIEKNLKDYEEALDKKFNPSEMEKRIRDFRELVHGGPAPDLQLPPAANFFNIDEWILKNEESYSAFGQEYEKQIRSLILLELKDSLKIVKLQSYFTTKDISRIIGLDYLREILAEYKTKSNDIFLAAVNNQGRLKNIQDLHTRKLNALLCEKLSKEQYCKENSSWYKSDQYYTPYQDIPSKGNNPLPPIPRVVGPIPLPGTNPYPVPIYPPSPYPGPRPFPMDPSFSSGFGDKAGKSNGLKSSGNWSSNNVNRAGNGEKICFVMQTEVATDSNLSASQSRPGIVFLSINGVGVPFYEQKENTRYYGTKEIYTITIGCTHRSNLRTNINQIGISYQFGDGNRTIGSHKVIFYANYGKQNQKTICDFSANGTTQGVYRCKNSMSLDLAELDPDLKKYINSLLSDINQLKIESLKANQNIENALVYLKRFENINFEDINSGELLLISEDLKDIAMLIEEVRSQHNQTVREIQLEIANTIKSQQSPEEVLAEALNRNYKYDKDDILGPVVLPDLNFLEAKIIAAYSTPKTKDTEASQEVIASYKKLSGEVIRSLENALKARNFKQADDILRSWKDTKGYLLQRLQQRKAGPREFKSFQDFIGTVDTFVERYFDKDGFSHAAKIPSDIKSQVAKATQSEFAKKIKVAMNQNDDNSLSSSQKIVQRDFYQMMRTYDEVLGYDKNRDYSNDVQLEVREDVEDGLLKMAQTGFRIGASFTPAGKFLDFCELVTGKALCLPNGEQLSTADRALSGLGIVLGSGYLLKTIAKSSIIKESVLVGDVMRAAVSSIEKMKGPLKIAGDKIYETGAKLIKLFSPTAKEITAVQLIERSSVEILNTLKSFKDFNFVNPQELNKIVQGGKVWMEPAFDIKYAAIRGILAKETKYVRFFTFDPKFDRAKRAWMLPASIADGLTPEQIKKLLAIENVPTHSVEVTVSEGVEIVMGRIAKNSMGGQREVMQIWIDQLETHIKNVHFGSPKKIDKVFKR